MGKKIIIILLMLSLTACKTQKLEDISLNDTISLAMESGKELYNVSNIGYKYYLPRGFILHENNGNVQTIKSSKIELFLNVDLISYYNKTDIAKNSSDNMYEFIEIKNKDKIGFLEIIKNNDYFLIKFVYNYAIIEAQVKEDKIKPAVMAMASILSSIKYNDNVINNKFGEDVLVLQETTYKIFGPVRETETKGYAYYLEQYDNYTGEIKDKIQDPDIIEQESSGE